MRTSKEVRGGDQRGEGWGEEGRNEKKGDRRHDGEEEAIRSREGKEEGGGGREERRGGPQAAFRATGSSDLTVAPHATGTR